MVAATGCMGSIGTVQMDASLPQEKVPKPVAHPAMVAQQKSCCMLTAAVCGLPMETACLMSVHARPPCMQSLGSGNSHDSKIGAHYWWSLVVPIMDVQQVNVGDP